MKILFAGPSLYGADFDLDDVELYPPAKRGDLIRAANRGVTVIGLVDGLYGETYAVQHKEVLYALSLGIQVLGGASMGALRAAECHSFGMVAIGDIAHRYLEGDLIDDAAVAIVHGPPELGSPPLSEALVDAEATLEHLSDLALIDASELRLLLIQARGLFFRDRTVEAMASAVPLRAKTIETLYWQHRQSLKQTDAIKVLEAVKACKNARLPPPTDWTLTYSRSLLQLLDEIANESVH